MTASATARPEERRTTPSRIAWGITTALAAILATHLFVSDSTWWGECVVVWPAVGWAILIAPRLALWTARRQWLDVFLVASALAIVVVVTGEWKSLIRAEDAPAAAGPRFRVVSWNVAGGTPVDDLASERADFYLLQETGWIDPTTLEGPLKGFTWRPEIDPAVLSRAPVETQPTRKVGPWQEPQVVVTTVGDRRVLLVNVRLMLPSIVVAAATFESPSDLIRLHNERRAQFEHLRILTTQTMERTGVGTVVLCGDFNSPGGMRSYEPLRGFLRDVWPEAGRGWGGTMTAAFPVSRIDQCWITPDLVALEARVRRGASDHRRLVVDLAWR